MYVFLLGGVSIWGEYYIQGDSARCVAPDQMSAGRQELKTWNKSAFFLSGDQPNESWNSPSFFSQAKAAIAAGDRHADAEMKDEQKDVAGSQPQVETEA